MDNKTNRTLRIDKDILNRLDDLALEQSRSTNNLIELVLKEYVNNNTGGKNGL